MSEWISVNDRLPDKDGRYLTNSRFGDDDYIRVLDFTLDAYSIDKYDFSEYRKHKTPIFYDYDSEWGYSERNNVTHWMPLPEPPQNDDLTADFVKNPQNEYTKGYNQALDDLGNALIKIGTTDGAYEYVSVYDIKNEVKRLKEVE